MKTLIALVGKSPAVLTCTLYALAKEDPPFWPDQVVVVTTSEGQAAVTAQLTAARNAGRKSVLDELADYLEMPRLIVGADTPNRGLRFALPSHAGQLDADAHGQGELNRMGALIFKEIYDAAQDPNSQVMCSLSGGRKSMAHLAGTAMSLVARHGKDALLHGLIEPEWLEHCGGRDAFFYPGCKPGFHELLLETEGGTQKVRQKSVDALVRLTRVPYLSLSSVEALAPVVAALGKQQLQFQQAIALSNAAIGVGQSLALVYKKSTSTFWLGGRRLLFQDQPYPTMAALRLIGNEGSVKPPLTQQQMRQRIKLLWEVLRPDFLSETDEKANADRSASATSWLKEFKATFKCTAQQENARFPVSRFNFNPETAELLDPSKALKYGLAKDVSRARYVLTQHFHGLVAPKLIGITDAKKEKQYRLGTALKYEEQE